MTIRSEYQRRLLPRRAPVAAAVARDARRCCITGFLPNVAALDLFSGVCLFVCLYVCLFVCQHDNFRTSRHRMMKLGGRCIVQKSRPSSNLGVIAPWVRTAKNVALGYDVGKISADCLVLIRFLHLSTRERSAPVRRARNTVHFLEQSTPAFIPPDMWPPNSTDLNAVDYKIWGDIQ